MFHLAHGIGHPPTIKINKYDDKIHEGASVNITATIKSGPPILSLKWGVLGGNLLPNIKTYTYNDGLALYSTLELKSLCFSYSGNYTITASNEVGTSKGFVPTQIHKSMWLASYIS